MMRRPPGDYWGTRYRRWIDALSRERTLPNRRVSLLVFALAYALVFAWRAARPDHPAPFWIGALATLVLCVRLATLAMVGLLRRELERPGRQRSLHAALRPLVNVIAIVLLMLLGSAYLVGYFRLPPVSPHSAGS